MWRLILAANEAISLQTLDLNQLVMPLARRWLRIVSFFREQRLHLHGVKWRYESSLGRQISVATVTNHLPPLVAAMLRPEFYPDKPTEVELRQTHISYVFIAGARVYKVKKNVKFPFLDYSTLDKRRHFCAEEVRLNRRLAPNTYIRTVGICRLGRAFSLDRDSHDSAHSVEEYAVEMNRLPDSRMLSSLLRHDAVDSECLIAIATKLAAFHAGAPSDKAAIYGSPQTIAANLRENFRATRPFVDRTITGPSFKTIKAYSEAFQKEHAALIAGRMAQGRVREGHGDLRAGTYLFGGQNRNLRLRGIRCSAPIWRHRLGHCFSRDGFRFFRLRALIAPVRKRLRSGGTRSGNGNLTALL
jgi:hypothetical protein